jgi:hypothetical protein
MNEIEAIAKIKKSICSEKPVQHYCNDSCMYGEEQCALSMAIEALEKQIPKKSSFPDVLRRIYCMECGCAVNDKQKYCSGCGQRLTY